MSQPKPVLSGLSTNNRDALADLDLEAQGKDMMESYEVNVGAYSAAVLQKSSVNRELLID